jgi:hypothetical protein
MNTKKRKVGQTVENIKIFLSSAGLKYNIIDVCEVAELGDSK